jgi:hypothetical protein
MKTATWRLLLVGCITAVLCAVGIAGEKLAWFDMENCEFCRQLAKDPDFLSCLHMETHKLSNGIVTVYEVAPEKMEQYRALHNQRRAILKKKLHGGEVQLCGHCQRVVELIESGCAREYVPTSTGGLCLFTAEQDKLREEIWSFHEKNEEMKQKMAPPTTAEETSKTG